MSRDFSAAPASRTRAANASLGTGIAWMPALPGCAATALAAARPSRVAAVSVTAKLSLRPSSDGRLTHPERLAITSAAMQVTLRSLARAARGRRSFRIDVSGIESSFVALSVSLLQLSVHPQRGERSCCARKQIQADVAETEIRG